MTPRLPINISVFSRDTRFVSRLKFFEKSGDSGFVFNTEPEINSPADLFLVDAELMEEFLSAESGITRLKFIVRGNQRSVKTAFDAGCTDFLRIPVYMDELEIRIKKVFSFPASSLVWKKICLTSRSLSREKKSVPITIEEYSVLKTLIQNRGEAVPREVLSFALWGSYKSGSRAVDMQISRLRKNIRRIQKNSSPDYEEIVTVRNYGYMIN